MYLILAILVPIVAYVLFLKKDYWKTRGIYRINRPNAIVRVIKNIFAQEPSFFQVGLDMYKELQDKKLSFGGTDAFFGRTFVATGSELVKNILIKDFDYFMDHGLFKVSEKLNPLSTHLFNLEGARWKKMRQNLTPTFTSGKMKMMFQTMLICTEELKSMFEEYANKNEGVPIVDSLARLTTDIIANVAFGIECNSIKNPEEQFRQNGKMAFAPRKGDPFRFILRLILPQVVLDFFKIKFMRQETENFFMEVVKRNAEYREKNNVVKKDFFQLLLQLKNQGKVTDSGEILKGEAENSKLTIEEVAAQCFLFFVAGFDTSSNVMSFALYELAINPDLQTKTRNSINEVLEKHNGEITYDAIQEMDYLHMVVSESMRKYPVLSILPRSCTKDYKIPDTDVVIEKGTRVFIPVAGLHRDPQYYPDPEKFDPERFNSENINELNGKCVYLPFGEGPRQCIGLRFGLLQSKVGLIMVLKNFQLSINNRSSGPLEIKPRQFITAPKDDIYLDLTRL